MEAGHSDSYTQYVTDICAIREDTFRKWLTLLIAYSNNQMREFKTHNHNRHFYKLGHCSIMRWRMAKEGLKRQSLFFQHKHHQFIKKALAGKIVRCNHACLDSTQAA